MPMIETTTYQVVCDERGCGNEAGESDYSEGMAVSYATQDGFVKVDGKWLCPTHATKLKTAPKKGSAKRSGK